MYFGRDSRYEGIFDGFLMIFGGFWSTTHRTETLTRTFLNPHAPHRAPTPTHPTPTTPHTARAPALRSRAVLRQRFVCILLCIVVMSRDVGFGVI